MERMDSKFYPLTQFIFPLVVQVRPPDGGRLRTPEPSETVGK